jgi:hypothetical protein
MPNWKKVIVSGSDAELNSLKVTTALTASGLHYPTSDGIAGQFLGTNGLGDLEFTGISTVTETVKNVSGHTLYKGTPVHATGSGTMGNIVGVIPASASLASSMPVTFILGETLVDGAEGVGIISGLIQGVNTSAFQNGEIIYVGANGGYTNIPPTGSNLIQNLGIVTKVHPTNGGGIVLGAGRSNATPNLLNGRIFYGTNNRSVERPLADIISGSILSYTGSFSGDGSNLKNISVYQVSTVSASYIATSSITVTHNFNSKNVIVSAYDNYDFYFIPQSIKLIDDNNVKLTFTSPSTGYVVIAKGGHIVSASMQGNQGTQGFQGNQGFQGTQGFQGNQGPQGFQGIAGTVSEIATVSASFAATSSITVAHNFNSKNVLVSTYDSDNYYFVPETINLIDNNRVKLTFSNSSTGYAVVAKGGHLVSATGFQGAQGAQGAQGSNAGITSYTNPSDNRVITSVSSTTINAESNLTFDGSVLTVTGTITETSSEKVKENIEELSNPLDIVKKLRGVQYNKKGNNIKEIGVIAEEINDILPQVVSMDLNGNPASVSYGRLTALLIEAIKELDNKLNKLK